MRTVIVVVFVAGCTGSPGPAGPQGPQGERGAQGAAGDTSALMEEVAALRGEVERLRALPRVKTPRAIHRETGEDLGPITGEGCYFDEVAQGEVCLRDQFRAVYATNDCTGIPMVYADARPVASESRLWIDQGRLWSLGVESEQTVRAIRSGASCSPVQSVKSVVVRFLDRGNARVSSVAAVLVELR